jgi:hypothetical protein
LRKYQEALAGQLAAVTENLSQLYRSNKVLARELSEVSARLTEEIDRRTREAVGEALGSAPSSPSDRPAARSSP